MRDVIGGAVLAAAIALGACSGDPPKADDVGNVERVASPVTLGIFLDESAAPPVHVQIKTCTTETPQSQQSVDCAVDSSYALVGGGAYAHSNTSALLTA